MNRFWKRCVSAAAALALGLSLTGCTTYKNFHAAFFEKDKEQEVIKIGVFEPQTGADAADAAEEIRGLELAHELYPEVMGKRIELVYGDNQSDVEMARTAAQQLVDSGVRLVLGSYKSTLSLAGSDVFEAADVPAIGISIKNPIVTQTNEFYFRVCFVDAFQGISAAYYVHDYLKQNDAVCFKQTGDDYADTMIEQFRQRMDRLTAGAGKVTVGYPHPLHRPVRSAGTAGETSVELRRAYHSGAVPRRFGGLRQTRGELVIAPLKPRSDLGQVFFRQPQAHSRYEIMVARYLVVEAEAFRAGPRESHGYALLPRSEFGRQHIPEDVFIKLPGHFHTLHFRSASASRRRRRPASSDDPAFS